MKERNCSLALNSHKSRAEDFTMMKKCCGESTGAERLVREDLGFRGEEIVQEAHKEGRAPRGEKSWVQKEKI
jgi:hypothetical protein